MYDFLTPICGSQRVKKTTEGGAAPSPPARDQSLDPLPGAARTRPRRSQREQLSELPLTGKDAGSLSVKGRVVFPPENSTLKPLTAFRRIAKIKMLPPLDR